MQRNSPVKIAFMTTVGVNVGDEFIREGICSFIDQLLPNWQPFYVNKHDLTTLQSRVYDESVLLVDKFKDADVIIQAGAPVYWKIGESTSYNVEWAEDLWRKRIFRLGPDKQILNIAAGACQPYPDTVRTFLDDPRCVDFANRVAAACRWTSVRDPLAAQILLALGHDHVALPCAAFHAARRVKQEIVSEEIIGINLMTLGGHFRLREDIDQDAWRATITTFLDGARRQRRIQFIAHDRDELSFMESLKQGDEQVFYSTDYRDYFPAYAKCQVVVANRVHGAVCTAGFGTPSIIIGNDTRLQIGDYIGLPSYYLADVSAEELLDRLDGLLTNRNKEHDRLITLREESARSYVEELGEHLVAAGTESLAGSGRFPAETSTRREESSERSLHLTLSSFAQRLSLEMPGPEEVHIIDALLSRRDSREFMRGDAAVLVVGARKSSLAYFMASLGARVTLAVVDAGLLSEELPAGFSRTGAEFSRVAISDGRIALKDHSFDMAVVCGDHAELSFEALRLLRPTGIGVMPTDCEPGLLGEAVIPGSEQIVIGTKALPIANQARVLIPRFDTFGDIVIFESFLAALRKKFPDMDICLLVRKGYDELAILFSPDLELRWVTVEQPAYITPDDQQRKEFARALKDLATDGWDLVLLTTYNRTWLDDLLLKELAGVSTIVLGSVKDVRKLSTSTRAVVPVEEWAHETEKYRQLLEKLPGRDTELPAPHLDVPASLAEEANQELARLNLVDQCFVVCLPAGTQNQKHKVWPLERYAEVLAGLHENRGLVPFLVGHEQEEAPIRSLSRMLVAKGIDAKIWLGREGGIPMLGALLKQAALFVGNDSGPMHIAAALSVPVVGVFGGGACRRFVPANEQAIAVIAEIQCFGCYWQCIFDDAPCVRLVDVETVKQGVELVLNDAVPTDRVLNVGAQLSDELKEIIEKAKINYDSCEQQQRDALNRERAKTEAIKKSLSWRVTAPLRWIVGRLP